MPDMKLRKALASDIPEMYSIDVDGWYQNFIDLERNVTDDVLKNKYGKVHDDPDKIKKFGETVLSDQQVSFVAEVEGKAGSKGFFKKFGFVEYPVTGRKEGPGNLYMIQMKRSSA